MRYIIKIYTEHGGALVCIGFRINRKRVGIIMTVEEIKRICEESDFSHFGIRADDMEYQIGDICNNSHQLFQDPIFDEFGDLMYPEVEDPDSPYYGYYDAGELNGTCAVKFNPDNEDSIESALEAVKMYSGKNLYIIAGDSIEHGNDDGEIIIREAEVIGKEKNIQ